MMNKALLTSLVLSTSLWADSTLAPSRLEVKDGYNMYLEGQFLWWLSQTDTLPVCQEGPTGSSSSTQNFIGHYKQMNTEFAPGWKVTFGGLMAYDHWDIHFTWTHFNQKAHAQSKNTSLYLGNSFGYSNLASSIRARYSVDLNMIDAIMTRPSWMGERFAISPYFGARGTWLDQGFTTKAYVNLSNNVGQTHIKNRSKSDFRGAGLLAGLGLRYELKGGWSIEGNFLTSGVYGKFVNSYIGKVVGAENPNSYQSHTGFQSTLFDVEYKLGFAYNRFIDQGRYHLGGGIAWEEVLFINGNRLPIWSNSLVNSSGSQTGLAQNNPSTMLNMQGITVRFVFGF